MHMHTMSCVCNMPLITIQLIKFEVWKLYCAIEFIFVIEASRSVAIEVKR